MTLKVLELFSGIGGMHTACDLVQDATGQEMEVLSPHGLLTSEMANARGDPIAVSLMYAVCEELKIIVLLCPPVVLYSKIKL